MEDNSLKVSASPHVRSKDTTSDIMFDVIIALVPATVFGIYHFGRSALLLVITCILSCVAFEALYQWGMKKKITVGDYSAVLTGLLLALNLPPTLPIWMAVVGSAFAIIIVKQLFGGLGQNFMNPALGGRCFLLLAFGKYMTTFVMDGVTKATPLLMLRNGLNLDYDYIKKMFLGFTAGTIGETSAAALLIGGIYLMIKRVISPRIPLCYIGSFAVCIAVYAAVKDYDVLQYTLIHLCGGGLMLGAWFMATDYVTSPITPWGKVVFGIILGVLTFILRIFGNSTEGVSYAIIFCNLLVPLIEKATVPKSFGKGAELSGKDKTKEKKASNKADKTGEPEAQKDKKPKQKAKFDGKSVARAILAIFVITLLMGGALGLVYNLTRKPIEDAQEAAKLEAYKEVFPSAYKVGSNNTSDYTMANEMIHSSINPDVTLEELAVAIDKEGNTLGYVLTFTTSQGYGGDITIMVGVNTSCVIQGISVLSHSESPGFGAEAEKPEFLNQFIGKEGVLEFGYTTTGNTSDDKVDAISGATITTKAFIGVINTSLMFSLLLGGFN